MINLLPAMNVMATLKICPVQTVFLHLLNKLTLTNCEKCLEKFNLGTLVDGICEKRIPSTSTPSVEDSEQSLPNPQAPPFPLHEITPTTCMCKREMMTVFQKELTPNWIGKFKCLYDTN